MITAFLREFVAVGFFVVGGGVFFSISYISYISF